MTDERRRESRKPVSIEARWEGMSGQFEARITDISRGGCFIDTFGKAGVGEAVSFALKLPSGEWLTLRGRVVSIDPEVGFSVCFISLSEHKEQALTQLLAV